MTKNKAVKFASYGKFMESHQELNSIIELLKYYNLQEPARNKIYDVLTLVKLFSGVEGSEISLCNALNEKEGNKIDEVIIEEIAILKKYNSEMHNKITPLIQEITGKLFPLQVNFFDKYGKYYLADAKTKKKLISDEKNESLISNIKKTGFFDLVLDMKALENFEEATKASLNVMDEYCKELVSAKMIDDAFEKVFE